MSFLPVPGGLVVKRMEQCSYNMCCCYLKSMDPQRASERIANSDTPGRGSCQSSPPPLDEGEALPSVQDSRGAKPPTGKTGKNLRISPGHQHSIEVKLGLSNDPQERIRFRKCSVPTPLKSMLMDVKSRT